MPTSAPHLRQRRRRRRCSRTPPTTTPGTVRPPPPPTSRKPVVRGEAGLDVPGRQDERALGVQRDLSGAWLHDFLWSGLDSGGLYELYWWRSHIWNDQHDARSTYRLVNLFLSDLDLNKGGYADWHGTSSQPRASRRGAEEREGWCDAPVDPEHRAHLEARGRRPPDRSRVWRDRRARLSSRGRPYASSGGIPTRCEKTILTHQDVVAAPSGNVTIHVDRLKSDVALKLRIAERVRVNRWRFYKGRILIAASVGGPDWLRLRSSRAPSQAQTPTGSGQSTTGTDQRSIETFGQQTTVRTDRRGAAERRRAEWLFG